MENTDNKYLDPDDSELKRIFDILKNCKTHDEIHKLIDETLPGWLIYSTDYYSKDYYMLTENWYKICDNLKVKPQKIILVDQINFDNKNHLLMHIFCERMTREGYIVRRKEELTICSECYNAIPTLYLYNILKQKGFKVPDRWSNKCINC